MIIAEIGNSKFALKNMEEATRLWEIVTCAVAIDDEYIDYKEGTKYYPAKNKPRIEIRIVTDEISERQVKVPPGVADPRD